MASLSLNSDHPAALRSSIAWFLSSAVNLWVPDDYEENTFHIWKCTSLLKLKLMAPYLKQRCRKVWKATNSNHLSILCSHKRDQSKASSVQNKLPPWHVTSGPLTAASNFTIQLLWLVGWLFWDRVSLCRPGWSVVVQSRLTATSASWAQMILPPQPPKQLGLQARVTTPG